MKREGWGIRFCGSNGSLTNKSFQPVRHWENDLSTKIALTNLLNLYLNLSTKNTSLPQLAFRSLTSSYI